MLPETNEHFRKRILSQLQNYYRFKINDYRPYSYLNQTIPNTLDLADEAYLWWLLDNRTAPQQDLTEIETSLRNLEQICREHSDLLKDKDLVDIGCGNAAKSIFMYQLLQNTHKNKIYFIDNANWLKVAEEAARREQIPYELRTCNFAQDNFFDQYDVSEKVCLLFGNTLSNFRRGAQARNLIRHLNFQIKRGGYLLVELTLHPKEYYQKDKQFPLDYLRALDEKLPIDEHSFDIPGDHSGVTVNEHAFWDLQEKKGFQMCFQLEKEYPINSEKNIPRNTVVIAAHSQRYTSDRELIRLFQKSGFKIIPIHGENVYKPNTIYRYVLLQKTEDLSDFGIRQMVPWLLLPAAVTVMLILAEQSRETDTFCKVTRELEEAIICLIREQDKYNREGDYRIVQSEIRIPTSDIYIPLRPPTDTQGSLTVKIPGRTYKLSFDCQDENILPGSLKSWACNPGKAVKNFPENNE